MKLTRNFKIRSHSCFETKLKLLLKYLKNLYITGVEMWYLKSFCIHIILHSL